MSKHIKLPLYNAFIGAVVAIAGYWVIQLGWWEFGTYPTADVIVPIQVLNEDKKVESGGELELLVFFDKNTNVTPTVTRNILCPSGANYSVSPVETSASRAQGQDQFSRPVFKLQQNIESEDGCIFLFKLDYQVNPIRVISREWASEPFSIIEAIE